MEYFPPFIIFFTLSYSSTKNKANKTNNPAKIIFKMNFLHFSVSYSFLPNPSIDRIFLFLSTIHLFLSFSTVSSILEFKGLHNQQYYSCIFNTLSLHKKSVFMYQLIYMLPHVMKHHNIFRANTPYLCGFGKMNLLFWTIMSSCKKIKWKKHNKKKISFLIFYISV